MSEINPEFLSYALNGILVMAVSTLGYYFTKAKPELNRLGQHVTKITQDIQVASSVLAQIKSLVTTCRTAAEDQTITPEEAAKILKEIEALVDSGPVKKLLNEG